MVFLNSTPSSERNRSIVYVVPWRDKVYGALTMNRQTNFLNIVIVKPKTRVTINNLDTNLKDKEEDP